MIVDLLFPARGGTVPTDHSYPLYGALARVVPAFHELTSGVRFAPLSGVSDQPGCLRLTSSSCLRVRLPDDTIRSVLPMAGKVIDVAGSSVRFGPPSVHSLSPAATVESWLVTFKNGEEPESFLATARTKLAEIGVAGKPAIRAFRAGSREGEPRRRVIRMKGHTVVGYAVVVGGLTDEESIRLQEVGLGGRTKLGCGFFLPATEDR